MSDRPAHHEAAHAVLAWLCGHPVTVTIDPTDPAIRGTGARGHCEILNPDCSLEDRLLVALGPFARGEDVTACWSDILDAVDLARTLRPEDPAAELNSYHVGAVNLLALPRIAGAVDALGRSLARRKTLDAGQAHRVIARAMSRRSRRKASERTGEDGKNCHPIADGRPGETSPKHARQEPFSCDESRTA